MCFLVEEVSLGAFSGGVSDHPRGATDEGEGFVTGLLEVAEHHHAAEVSDVQGVGGRVNADVGSCHPFGKHFVCSGHHLMQYAAPFQSSTKFIVLWFLVIYVVRYRNLLFASALQFIALKLQS